MLIYTNANAFTTAIRRIVARLPGAVDAAMDQARTEGEALLSATTSFRNRTGLLRSSFADLSPAGTRGPSSRQIGSTVEYAKFLEFGTRAITERRFLRDAVDDLSSQFSERMSRALRAVL